MSKHVNAMGESLGPSDSEPRTKVRDVLLDVSSNILSPSLPDVSARVAHFFACSSVRARNSKLSFELIFYHLKVNTHVHYSLPIEGYAPRENIWLSYICLEIVTNNTGLNEFSRYQPSN